MKIGNVADISAFQALSDDAQPTSGGCSGVFDGFVPVNNVDISLYSLVMLSENAELRALYDKIKEYGTEDKADTMLRGFRPRDLTDLVNLLRRGLNIGGERYNMPQKDIEKSLGKDRSSRDPKEFVDWAVAEGKDLRGIKDSMEKSASRYKNLAKFRLLHPWTWLRKNRRLARNTADTQDAIVRQLTDKIGENDYSRHMGGKDYNKRF